MRYKSDSLPVIPSEVLFKFEAIAKNLNNTKTRNPFYMRHDNFYIYIMASHSGTLYIGVTNNLEKRVYEHKQKLKEGFTKKYNCCRLVYYEHFTNISQAISAEKRIKKWRREKKEWLIKTINPKWADLSKEFI